LEVLSAICSKTLHEARLKNAATMKLY